MITQDIIIATNNPVV